jgi:HD-like signal output (HDOD) protein
MSQPEILEESATEVDKEAFAFVQMLADELSKGQIELPSFPDAAIKVRQALTDEEVSIEKVQRLVSSEPALAARIMQMANSAALNHTGRKILDVKSAIARIGFNLVRSASLVFAMAQMRKAEQLAPVRALLQAHWQRSNKVAAFCHIVAKRFSKVNPDTALLTGLLHAVGRLYIISRSIRHPQLFANAAAFVGIEREWGPAITDALLGNWGLDGAVLEAVKDYEDLGRDHEGATDLTDILSVGVLLASLHEYPDALELNLQNVKAAERMQLDRAALDILLAESKQEMAVLQAALSA